MLFPPNAVAQTGVILHGHYTLGAQVGAFRPCGTATTYRVTGTGDINTELESAHRRLTSEPNEGIYVVIAGWRGTEPVAGPGAALDGLWRVTRLDFAKTRQTGDCTGSVPPPWIDDRSGIDCEGDAVTTVGMRHCLLIDLMIADSVLREAATGMRDLENNGVSMSAAQREWEDRREAECLAEYRAYEGGSMQTVQMFACRIRMSRERLAVILNIAR